MRGADDNESVCAFCGGEVHRFRSRDGQPYKYCSPECDKAAMSHRLRKFSSRVLTVQQSPKGQGWKLFKLECGHRVDILMGDEYDGLFPETIKCHLCEEGVTA